MVTIFDARTLEVTGEAEVRRRPDDVTVSPDGGRVYVAAFWSDAVLVLDADLTAVARIPVGAGSRSARTARTSTPPVATECSW
jgi:YVTN family beta-propeller protein